MCVFVVLFQGNVGQGSTPAICPTPCRLQDCQTGQAFCLNPAPLMCCSHFLKFGEMLSSAEQATFQSCGQKTYEIKIKDK